MKKENDKVLIFGYYGTSNVGSEARLQVIVEDVRKANPNAEITIAGFNYYKEKGLKGVKYFHMKTVSPWQISKLIRTLKNYDYIINGEGIPYVDFCGKGFLGYFLPVLYWAHKFGKKTASYCFDIDYLTKLDSWITKKVLEETDLLIVRTLDSWKQLKKMGVHHKTYITSDCAFLFQGVPKSKLNKQIKFAKKKKSKSRIGIALKDFFCYPVKIKLFGKKEDLFRYPYYYAYANKGKEKYSKFVDLMATFIDNTIEKYNSEVFLVIMEDMMDHKVTKEVYFKLKNKSSVKIVSGKTHSPAEVKTLISTFDMMISSRLHALILSVNHYIPLIGISSDERFQYFFDELGMKKYCIDAKNKDFFNLLKNRVEEGFKEKDFISKRLKEKNKYFVKKAKENPQLLKKFFKK